MYKHKTESLNKTTFTEINTPISGISINQEEMLSEKSYIIYSHLEKYDIYLLQNPVLIFVCHKFRAELIV